ncbi:hypothetical protein KCU93_g8497, partial [Aureobasidium melanogenum]
MAISQYELTVLLKNAVSASDDDHNLQLIKLLIDLGAELNYGSGYGLGGPLEMALRSNAKLATLSILLENGADPSPLADRSVMFRLARERRRSEFEPIALLLLQHGADPTSLENAGYTPLLTLASVANMPRLTRKSLDNGATPDALGAVTRTALTYAAKRGHTEIVQMLLEADASPNPRNPDKSVPIHLATANGHSEVVKLLSSWGADERGIHCSVARIGKPDNGGYDDLVHIGCSSWASELRTLTEKVTEPPVPPKPPTLQRVMALGRDPTVPTLTLEAGSPSGSVTKIQLQYGRDGPIGR